MKPFLITACLLVVYVIISVYLSDFFDDHEFVNRTGAMLSALGALLVIYQAMVETKIEHRRSSEVGMLAGSHLSPLNVETAQRIFRERATARTKWRIQLVICIASIVFVGEFLHGFGDVLSPALRFLPGRSAGLHQEHG